MGLIFWVVRFSGAVRGSARRLAVAQEHEKAGNKIAQIRAKCSSRNAVLKAGSPFAAIATNDRTACCIAHPAAL